MHHSSPLPAAVAGKPFAQSSALDLGVGRGRLRAADLVIPFRGTRASSAAAPSVGLLAAGHASLMPAHQLFSHWTAAALFGLRLPEGGTWRTDATARLDVAVTALHRAPGRRGVRGHEIQSSVTVRTLERGLRVTSPSDTWIQLASELSIADLIVMGDGLVGRRSPLATIPELIAAVAQAKGRPGSARRRDALGQIRARTDLARETLLRLKVVRAGLPEPEVNGVIRNRFGAQIGLGDLVYAKERVLIEYDGAGHGNNDRQFAVDIRSLDEFTEEGVHGGGSSRRRAGGSSVSTRR